MSPSPSELEPIKGYAPGSQERRRALEEKIKELAEASEPDQ